MSTYDITPTDPLKSGFLISPGSFNGPGGTRANSTMRLYGRGALEWGEAVDENLLRLTETFAGSTPPLNPSPGQLWMCIKYYWHDTSAGTHAGWWTYSPDGETWSRLNGTGAVATGAVANPTIGSYYYDSAAGVLYRWDTAYKQAASAHMPRHFSSSNLGGAAPTKSPEHQLLVWNQFTSSSAGEWVTPLTIAAQLTAPTDPQVGMIWYDQTTGKLKVWTGTVWKEILGPTNSSNVMSGDLDMANHHINNLASGTIASGNTQAVSGGAVYDYITGSNSALSGQFLRLTGGTVTGALTVNGTTTLAGLTASSLTVSGSSTLAALSATSLNVSGTTQFNSNRIQHIGTPTATDDAATKGYVDTSISNLGASLGGISSGNVVQVYGGTGTHKAGDIYVSGSNIYIAIASGSTPPPSTNWKLVYPAAFL